jgi:hypothetical protein
VTHVQLATSSSSLSPDSISRFRSSFFSPTFVSSQSIRWPFFGAKDLLLLLFLLLCKNYLPTSLRLLTHYYRSSNFFIFFIFRDFASFSLAYYLKQQTFDFTFRAKHNGISEGPIRRSLLALWTTDSTTDGHNLTPWAKNGALLGAYK